LLPSLLRNELLLSLEVICGNVIGLDDELSPEQVISPCAEIMYYCSHFLLLHHVVPLSVIELSALKGDGMTLLHQDTTNSKDEAFMWRSNGLLRLESAKTGYWQWPSLELQRHINTPGPITILFLSLSS